MTTTSPRWLLTVALTVFIFRLSTAAAQLAPAALGAEPGFRIEVPFAVDLLTDEPIASGTPTVFVFSVLHPCSTCDLAYTIADDWARTYPNLQVVLVTKAADSALAAEVRREALSRGIQAKIVIDEGAYVSAFKLSTQPVLFLLDGSSTVQARLTGSNPGRLLAFDELLAMADRGDWTGVVAQQHEPLVKGVSTVPPPLQQYFTGSPLVVYIHSPTCIHCRRLVEHGVQDLINDYARLHPHVSFVVLQETTHTSIVDVLGNLVSRFGVDVLYEPERSMFLNGESVQGSAPLQPDNWEDNVAFATFVAGGDNDPGWQWGRVTTPDVLSFDRDGVFVGPQPYWQGSYDLAGLAQFLNRATRD